jgi:flavin-binding protein dodecin
MPALLLCSGDGGSSDRQDPVALEGAPDVADHIYKKIELTGSSTVSSDDAIKNAIAEAAKTVKNMRWFEVVEVRGHIDHGAVAYWQVTLKIGFTLESSMS